jgi:hypothetical protein
MFSNKLHVANVLFAFVVFFGGQIVISARADDGPPPPTNDCSGQSLERPLYNFEVRMMNGIAAQYRLAFDADYEFCSEFPLEFACDPAGQTNGWRILPSGGYEEFWFQPLDYVPLSRV